MAGTGQGTLAWARWLLVRSMVVMMMMMMTTTTMTDEGGDDSDIRKVVLRMMMRRRMMRMKMIRRRRMTIKISQFQVEACEVKKSESIIGALWLHQGWS